MYLYLYLYLYPYLPIDVSIFVFVFLVVFVLAWFLDFLMPHLDERMGDGVGGGGYVYENTHVKYIQMPLQKSLQEFSVNKMYLFLRL